MRAPLLGHAFFMSLDMSLDTFFSPSALTPRAAMSATHANAPAATRFTQEVRPVRVRFLRAAPSRAAPTVIRNTHA